MTSSFVLCIKEITMRLSAAIGLALIYSVFALSTNTAQAFALRPQRTCRKVACSKHQQLARKQAPSALFRSTLASEEDTMVTPSVPPQRGGVNNNSSSLAVGFFGKSGLLLLSVFLVKLVYSVFFNDADAQSAAEPRCPWPFIISHDPKQFMKDSPTWMIITYVILLRITKLLASKGTAA